MTELVCVAIIVNRIVTLVRELKFDISRGEEHGLTSALTT